MAKPPKSDPTKDPTFRKVVGHFLKTPPQPHAAPKAKPKPSGKGGKKKAGG